jgi:glycosyltransferase involved in cell wall biosynthesis
MLEALRCDHQVTLLTQRPPRFAAVDAIFGTRLAAGGVTVELAPRVRLYAPPLALFRQHQLFRAARALHHRFDVVVSNENEISIGRRCIQYVHHPWGYLPRPEVEMRWYHRLPGALAAYRAASYGLSGFRAESMVENLTLANSAWTAARLHDCYGMDHVMVVPPPVVGAGTPPPWFERRSGFVQVGRISREKRIEFAVEVLERVRAAGHDIAFDLAGTADDRSYAARLRPLLEKRPWIQRHEAISRDELSALFRRTRYGIHAMVDEHFGMAVAEMARAGCVTFAHASGGPREILDDSRLLYEDVDDAVAKILAVLRSAELQAELGRHVARRAERYSEESFTATIRELVEQWND